MTETETLRLTRELRLALHDMARQDDVSAGQLMRQLISREISRRSGAKPPVRADERLVAPLRARLAGDLASAPSWEDLQRRLRAKGYELRQTGGGLTLHAAPGGQRLCKASELGFSYSRLMRRIGAPYPGHGHQWLADRMLPAPGAPHHVAPEEDDDDIFEVIERD